MVATALTMAVTGSIQGVGFRYGVCRHARVLGISGCVKNNPDGSVTIIAEADRTRLQAFLDWCYTGVRSARVDRIRTVWGQPKGLYQGFNIATDNHS
ncbi:MAG: acylphosphatase [bacterium]|nr:acylphosphatase [bacterium]